MCSEVNFFWLLVRVATWKWGQGSCTFNLVFVLLLVERGYFRGYFYFGYSYCKPWWLIGLYLTSLPDMSVRKFSSLHFFLHLFYIKQSLVLFFIFNFSLYYKIILPLYILYAFMFYCLYSFILVLQWLLCQSKQFLASCSKFPLPMLQTLV